MTSCHKLVGRLEGNCPNGNRSSLVAPQTLLEPFKSYSSSSLKSRQNSIMLAGIARLDRHHGFRTPSKDAPAVESTRTPHSMTSLVVAVDALENSTLPFTSTAN